MIYCLLHEYNNGADSYLFRCDDPMPKLDDHQLLKLAEILKIEKKERPVFTMSVVANPEVITSPMTLIPSVNVEFILGDEEAKYFVVDPSCQAQSSSSWLLCQTLLIHEDAIDCWGDGNYSVVAQADDRDGILLAAHVRNIPEDKLEWL